MKKVIRLTESDLRRIVKRVIMEQGDPLPLDKDRDISNNNSVSDEDALTIAIAKLGAMIFAFLSLPVGIKIKERIQNKRFVTDISNIIKDVLKPEQWKLIRKGMGTQRENISNKLNQSINRDAIKSLNASIDSEGKVNGQTYNSALSSIILNALMDFVNSELSTKRYELDSTQISELSSQFKSVIDDWVTKNMTFAKFK